MSDTLSTAEAVQAEVGKLAGARNLKVIDFADEHAARWLAASPLGFLAFDGSQQLSLTLAGGSAGFARLDSPRNISIPLSCFDDASSLELASSFGALFLLPGVDETLRINGRVCDVADDLVHLMVDECYLHCAKALIRSSFWAADLGAPAGSVDAHVVASRFLALATVNSAGEVDVSPKGDPAGALLRLSDDRYWFPDRPGNRRIDSFRNLVEQPRLAMLVLVPGSDRVLPIRGQAEITRKGEQLDAFAVQGKRPKIVTAVRPESDSPELTASAALRSAQLWPAPHPPPDLRPAEIFKDHVKLSREGGLNARLARMAVSIPGVMQRGLESDYKKNLY